jgi:hypothetical protein
MYALLLPVHAVLHSAHFTDPRSPNGEFTKSVFRDDDLNRYVIYLECRSSYGWFDFDLRVEFAHSPSDFATSSYRDNETQTEGQGHYAMVRQMTQGQVESFFAARIDFTENIAQDRVFISYSHEDTKWREDLEKHLKPYLRAGSIKSWSDKQISPGSQWLTEIKTALTNTKVAVLLVTPDFIASDFIHEYELGPFLKEAKRGGVRILWVPVRASSYRKTALKDYEAVLDPARPLAYMTDAERDHAWVKICEELESALALSPAPGADLSSNKPDEAAAPLEDINGDAIAARNAKDSVEAAVAKKSPDVEVDPAVLKPEDPLQRAQASSRKARRDYESLSVNAENQRTRIDALYRWKDSAQDYFSKQADAFLIKQPRTENSWNESYAERVLNELADHHATIGQAARQLGIDPRTLVPAFIKFKKLQSFLRDKEPDVAQALRNRYIAVGLPTYGLEDGPPQNLEWRWFILGCVLLLISQTTPNPWIFHRKTKMSFLSCRIRAAKIFGYG